MTGFAEASSSGSNLPRGFIKLYINRCVSGSSVGKATELRDGGSGIESRWGRVFLPFQTGLVDHPASYTIGTGSFPGVVAAGA